jgi:hypothetical protein
MTDRGHLALVSAATGSGVGLVVICGFMARTAVAVTKHHDWNQVREFLGIRGKRNWYTTWTRL